VRNDPFEVTDFLRRAVVHLPSGSIFLREAALTKEGE
jgi:hypothetical protein